MAGTAVPRTDEPEESLVSLLRLPQDATLAGQFCVATWLPNGAFALAALAKVRLRSGHAVIVSKVPHPGSFPVMSSSCRQPGTIMARGRRLADETSRSLDGIYFSQGPPTTTCRPLLLAS